MQLAKLSALSVDAETCPGGLAVWGTVEAILDTSRPPRQEGFERGIHVHGRMNEGGRKHINTTHSSVSLSGLPYQGYETIEISIDMAIYFVVLSSIHNNGLLSPYAEREILSLSDADRLAANVTSEYLNRLTPRQTDIVDFLKDLNVARPIIRPKRTIDLTLDDLRCGVQLWGSNKAMVWRAINDEEEGIHVHGFDEYGRIKIDGTFDTVTILGRSLDDAHARQLMAQAQFREISGSIVSLSCSRCGNQHFDAGIAGLMPHLVHVCEACGTTIAQEPARQTVSNPALAVLRNAERESGVNSRTPPLCFPAAANENQLMEW